MLKSDMNEIKKRLKKDKCLPSKVSGCCVSTNKEILATFHNRFGNLEEGDQMKYLEMAGKIFSGKIGNNILELSFPIEAEAPGGSHDFLVRLRDSDFEDDELKEEFFKKVIENYDTQSEYVILIFHEVYDVPDKTSDGIKLDESSSVYDYMLCVICPLDEAKPGLIYSHSEQVIKERIRDWVVCDPDIGFIFPAFTERETDLHSMLYHIKNPEEAQEKFVSEVLGCPMIQTTNVKKEVFADIISETLAEEENVGRLIYDINDSLRNMIDIEKNVEDPETGEVTGTRIQKEDVEVSNSVIKAVLEENEIEEEKIEIIQKAVQEEMTGNTSVDQIIDRKLLEKEKHIRREEELLLEIAALKEEIKGLKEKLRSIEGA